MAMKAYLFWQLNNHRRGKKLLYRARAKITADSHRSEEP